MGEPAGVPRGEVVIFEGSGDATFATFAAGAFAFEETGVGAGG